MIENLIDCDNPMYGKAGIALAASAVASKSLNKWVPQVGDINEWVILFTGILAAILIYFKIRSVRAGTKLKHLEIEQKQKEIEAIDKKDEE